MKFDSLVGHALELYLESALAEGPAERAVARYFHARRYLGSRDRAAIGELAWSLLRARVRAQALDRLLGELTAPPEAADRAHAAVANDASRAELAAHANAAADADAAADAPPAAVALKALPEVARHLIWMLRAPVSETAATINGAAAHAGWPSPAAHESWPLALAAALQRHGRADAAEQIDAAWSEAAEWLPKILPRHPFGPAASPPRPEPHEPAAPLAPKNAELALGFPLWLAQGLRDVAGESWPEEARALLGPAPLALRVNTLRANRADVLDELIRLGVPAAASSLSPDGIVLAKRVNLETFDLYREGCIEVQDEGSQLVAAALLGRVARHAAGDQSGSAVGAAADAAAGPSARESETQPGRGRGLRILDACAGGGGKALHLAALLGDEGDIFAYDPDERRLDELRRRARRAGATCIQTVDLERAEALRELNALLIDAPCSGLGTLRRRPDLLFKSRPEDVADCARVQAALLRKWAGALERGGVLVYATCTFMREENDAVIESFVREHPEFAIEDPIAMWTSWHGGAPPEPLRAGWTGLGRQLTPARQGCDAFYIARLRRTA